MHPSISLHLILIWNWPRFIITVIMNVRCLFNRWLLIDLIRSFRLILLWSFPQSELIAIHHSRSQRVHLRLNLISLLRQVYLVLSILLLLLLLLLLQVNSPIVITLNTFVIVWHSYIGSVSHLLNSIRIRIIRIESSRLPSLIRILSSKVSCSQPLIAMLYNPQFISMIEWSIG